MTGRVLRRSVALLVVVVGAGLLSSCSNTLTDAASITYRDGSGSHTVHISNSDFVSQVRQLISTKALRDAIASNGQYPNGNGVDSVDAKFTANWMSIAIYQRVYDSLFNDAKKSVHLTVTDADRTQAPQIAYSRIAAQQLFDALPKKLKDSILADQARISALFRTCTTDRVLFAIQVATKDDAESIFQQISRSSDPQGTFNSLARAQKTQQLASSGGAIGCVAPGLLVAGLQDAADTLPYDTVSVPVRSVGSNGAESWNIVLVRHWSDAYANDQNISQSVSTAARALFDNRLQSMKVHLDPRYGSWGPQDDGQGGSSLGVAPPVAPQPRDAREKS